MKVQTAIGRLVSRRQALGVVGRFQIGWSVAKLSRYYGLSSAGVQDLIRLHWPTERKR